ncbi:amino acid adenylation domain-containing protein, partial [Gordonia defluvii]|uniref:amino acid adenylation domain-containing protein n=1 Tax=Gordonia defluvii TaxID=283718 RepID=UPI0031D500E9
MTTGEIDVVRFSDAWGRSPSTFTLVTLAVGIAPDAVAFEGANGPITFAALHARAAVTAGVLQAQGLDADASIAASISGFVDTSGKSPVEVAALVHGTAASIRSAAIAVVGTSDWESLPGLFRSAAHRFADRPAVTDQLGATMTYGELDALTDRIAAALVERGVRPSAVVALALPRTIGIPIAILAVLKAGATYVPLDAAHPPERLKYIVGDADPVLVIADSDGIADLDFLDRPLVTLQELAETEADAQLPSVVDPRTVAYMIYTSGSTGLPKGVQVEHRNAVALMATMNQLYHFDETDVWTQFQSYSFDFSVWEIWGVLLTGGQMLVIDFTTSRSPAEFVELLHAARVTVLCQTSAAFYQTAEAWRRSRLALSLRYVFFGGEALALDQITRWYKDAPTDPAPVLVHAYGPTEATVLVTQREFSASLAEQTVGLDIGFALPNTQVYLLDGRFRQVPEGVPGEIYISGPQVARGYLSRMGLTAARFVADPFGDGTVMYRSGDRALQRDGHFEYLGRGDAQIQLRGFRIEYGEVEAALFAPGVVEAAVDVRRTPGGVERLIGYVVVDAGDGEYDTAQVRAFAGGRVPSYMVPDVVMVVAKLPLTVNGKLDRAALPTPEISAVAEYVAPANDLERDVAAVIAEVIGIERVSATESIFDVGGNSLIAAQIAARIGEDLHIPASFRDVFEAPTVVALAARIGGRAHEDRLALVAGERPAVIPLSPSQRRIWFISELDPLTPIYNIPLVLRFGESLDPVVLDRALRAVIERHEVLRTRFPSVDGQPRQEILAAGSYEPELAVAVPQSVEGDGLYPAVSEVAGVGFDLAAAPPLRARLFREADGSYVLVWVFHHVVGDGGSLTPLAGDLVQAYSALEQGAGVEWAPLEVQFADYALWHDRLLGDPADPDSLAGRQLGFWGRALAGAPELLALPLDRSRPPRQSQRALAYRFEVAPDLVAQLA